MALILVICFEKFSPTTQIIDILLKYFVISSFTFKYLGHWHLFWSCVECPMSFFRQLTH